MWLQDAISERHGYSTNAPWPAGVFDFGFRSRVRATAPPPIFDGLRHKAAQVQPLVAVGVEVGRGKASVAVAAQRRRKPHAQCILELRPLLPRDRVAVGHVGGRVGPDCEGEGRRESIAQDSRSTSQNDGK